MKRVILGLSILAIGVATTLVACKKDEVKTPKTNGYTHALERSREINNKYKSGASNAMFRSANSKAGVTVMADVAAAGLAAKTMGGLWLSAPWGTIASACVTVCAGASSSILAHDAQKRLVSNPSMGTSQAVYNHANGKLLNHLLVPDSNPFSNLFDSIGFRHNELVKRYYTTPNNYFTPNSTSFLFNTDNLTADENSGLTYTSITSLTNLVSYQYANPITDAMSLESYLTHAYTLYGNNQFLIDFSNTLLEGVYECETYDQLVNLAHDYEEYYVPNFQGTAEERRVILISLATLKYSAKLWKAVNED